MSACRLTEGKHVAPEAIAEVAFAATVRLVREAGRLLCIGDTTTIVVPHASVRNQLGDVGGADNRAARGCVVHSSILTDGDAGAAPRLIDPHWFTRDAKGCGRRHKRKVRPYREKESYKWLAACERIAARLGGLPQRLIVVVASEAEVCEFVSVLLGLTLAPSVSTVPCTASDGSVSLGGRCPCRGPRPPRAAGGLRHTAAAL